MAKTIARGLPTQKATEKAHELVASRMNLSRL